ncbi:hypothetical protein EV644_103100 [Kribbella orskensis]|uniref:Uncharacterized protein n=1 Tax=Kribbella orskensis TaxID=2512216 RepID=A0ABY2BQ29_9ACTN|nr:MULTISPECIES: hypothetical protein [Kribbella]TCN39814.1 hypothetical protein EV642_106320 [Kribbella sp. VKM Ac-2500]TCO27403.1 hypothetical protein EV644_103100 [Kribbella orskensis]
MASQPIPPRAGRPAPEEMRSSVSPALRAGLQRWLGDWLVGNADAQGRAVLVAIGLDLDFEGRTDWAFGEILSHADQGDDELLDAVHVTLGVLASGPTTLRAPPHLEVARLLAVGRSAWSATEEGLVHRADPTAQAAFELATSIPGSVSTELTEAWEKAHARQSKPGDAWDHAIKAVEAVLIPIVLPPTQIKPNLGHVLGQLRQLRGQTELWTLGVRGQSRDNSIQPLVSMLTLLWPDPNRHGSPNPEPPATPEEGRVMANLATTIVQWARDGLITRR